MNNSEKQTTKPNLQSKAPFGVGATKTKKMKYYITRKAKGYTAETVDEASTKKEANYLRKEYQISDSAANYYISNNPCPNWN